MTPTEETCVHEWRLPDHGYGYGVGAMFNPNELTSTKAWEPVADMTDIAWCQKCGTLYRYGRIHMPSANRDAAVREQGYIKALEAAATGLSHAVMFCAGVYSSRGMTMKQTDEDKIFKGFVHAKNVVEAVLDRTTEATP